MEGSRPKRRWTLDDIARWKASVRGSASTRLVAREIADRAGHDPDLTGRVQVSVRELKEETGVAEGTVKLSIRRLEEERRLKRHPVGGRPGEKRQEGNEIELLFPEGEEGPPPRAGPTKKNRSLIAPV